MPPAFLRHFSSGNIVIEIDYVDYVVARNLQGTLDSWVSEIERESTLGWIRYVQRYSHLVAPIAQLILLGLIGTALYHSTPVALPATATPAQNSQWLILSGTAITMSGLLGKRIGGILESSIDQILTISAITLNKGDERLLKRYGRRNAFKIAQAFASLIILLAQGISTNLLTEFLTDWVSGKTK